MTRSQREARSVGRRALAVGVVFAAGALAGVFDVVTDGQSELVARLAAICGLIAGLRIGWRSVGRVLVWQLAIGMVSAYLIFRRGECGMNAEPCASYTANDVLFSAFGYWPVLAAAIIGATIRSAATRFRSRRPDDAPTGNAPVT